MNKIQFNIYQRSRPIAISSLDRPSKYIPTINTDKEKATDRSVNSHIDYVCKLPIGIL